MNLFETILGTDVPVSTRAILYLCDYTGKELKVINEILFDDAFEGLNAYANIPNPESQLITGKTYDDLIHNMTVVHSNMIDKDWLKDLGDYL